MQIDIPDATDVDLEQLTAVFRVLSDKTRLNILLLLAEGERNVTSLCIALKLPQPTVSHHLGLLRLSNLIGNRREGKQIFYELNERLDATTAALIIAVENYEVCINRKSEAATV